MISMKHANCYLMQFDHGSLNSLYFLRKSNDFCTCASAARHGSSAVQAPSRPQKSLKNHCYDNKSFKSVVPALVLQGFPDHTMRGGVGEARSPTHILSTKSRYSRRRLTFTSVYCKKSLADTVEFLPVGHSSRWLGASELLYNLEKVPSTRPHALETLETTQNFM